MSRKLFQITIVHISKGEKILFYALFSVLIFAIRSFGLGYTENDLIMENGQLEITGLHGEKIPLSEIQLVELPDKRPSLRNKINGFSMGNRKKGFFKTDSGERIKAIINSNARPWILITKKIRRKKIFFVKRTIERNKLPAAEKSFT
ncbi:hypothetical protein [Maribacter sp. 2308TA10-17]|uniref:hypothetical protein n=1 Tax=Maribacter sp. 2308TA10-17 TaxID=3386276 RepID=UPI0039BC888C